MRWKMMAGLKDTQDASAAIQTQSGSRRVEKRDGESETEREEEDEKEVTICIIQTH